MSERIDESSGWPIVNLVEQLEQIIDNRGKTPIKADSGIPSLSAKSVKMGVIEYEKVYFVSQETYDKFMVRGLPKVGDVLLTTEAPLGCVARLDRDDVCLAQRLITLRGKEGVLDNDYLRLYLSSSLGQHELISRASGSTVQGIKRTEFSKIDIVLPPFKKQLEIAKGIRAIEEKIEVNQQTNQTLEHIAQAIFKCWFVDFEPTRAKIIAKEKGSNTAIQELAAQAIICGAMTLEQLEANTQNLETTLQQAINEKLSQANQTPINAEQLKTTAALFPNALVDSDGVTNSSGTNLHERSEPEGGGSGTSRLIPEGWRVVKNGDVMDVRDGTHDSPKQSERGYPLVTSKHITTGILDLNSAYLISEEDYEKVNNRSKVNQGDILLTMIGTVGLSYLVMQPVVNFAIKNVALFRTSAVKELKNYFYLLLKSSAMKAYLDARMAGTTQKYLSLKTLRSIDMLMPPADLLGAFNLLVNPMMERVFALQEESDGLKSIRDALLPKLLSGELKVS